MPALMTMLKSCGTPGIFWHKPSQRFLCYIGYHEVARKDANGFITKDRIRTTHYLGTLGEEEDCVAKFNAINDHWERIVGEQRTHYDAEASRRKLMGLRSQDRFKPVWPAEDPKPTQPSPPVAVGVPTPPAPRLIHSASSRPTGKELLNMTVAEARTSFLARQKQRIGLMNGKGINENTYEKFESNLTLALGMNSGYSRPCRPIDINKKLGDLTLEDYETFVNFWCNPANIKSERGGLNYIRAFKQMIDRMKLPTPDDYAEVFAIKIMTPTNIVRYDPEILRPLLNCKDEKARLFSLLCLNCGYYAIDIKRLRPEHLTDAEGLPYRSGEMFITRRREKTSHQNTFLTTCYLWPETQQLLQRHKARENKWGMCLLSKLGSPYKVKTISGRIEQVIRDSGLAKKFSVKQFRKMGASQIKMLADSDAMHMYKANVVNAADRPYIADDFSRLTAALKKFREKLIADKVICPTTPI